ncbi:MAG: hypothetical protein ABWX67_09575 [Allosphingosinicella sp.]
MVAPREQGSALERQADRYAADLLMPAYLKEFSTSRLANSLRFADLSRWPCIIVCHGPEGRRWFRRSADVPTRWFPQNDLDSESSAMDVLYGRAGRSAPSLIGADAGFDRWNADRFDLREQSVKGHGDEVLSLLTLTDADMLE